ncbi:MAG: acyl carrier protein [Acidobacteria bacterium]|nr:acyl carrier protein [Acidobacteriota bacterium]
MTNGTVSYDQITHLLSEKVHIKPPSLEADLLESGLLDSLTLVELMSSLEEQFGIRISFDEIEIENFRSVKNIAEFVNGHGTNKELVVSS